MRRNMKHPNLLVFSHDIGEDVDDNEDTVSIISIIISFVHVCRTSLSVGQLLGKIFIIDLLARFCVHLLFWCPICASFCRMLLSAQPSVSPELNWRECWNSTGILKRMSKWFGVQRGLCEAAELLFITLVDNRFLMCYCALDAMGDTFVWFCCACLC